MRSDKRKKLAVGIGLILCFLLLVGGILSGMSGQVKAVPDNPMDGISQKRSQVLYTGTGYYTSAISKKENQKTDLPKTEVLETETESEAETETETELETELQTEVTTETETGGTETTTETGEAEEPVTTAWDDPDMGEADYRESGDDDQNQDQAQIPTEAPETESETEAIDMRPLISSDLEDGETIHKESRVLSVYAEDYKERALEPIDLTVTCNGERLSSISTDNGVIKYKAYLDDTNEISITATDRYGNTDTVSVTVYKEITGDEEEDQPAGTITFSVEASTMGLGNLIGPVNVSYYDEETLPYVLNRVLYQYGYTYHYSGSMDSGFYLKSIDRAGITDGYHVPDAIVSHLEDVNDIPDPDTCSADWLGEGTLTGGSGWMYSVNGTYMSSGMNTYFPADGDVIRVRFTLYYGADIGEAMQGRETWGDW